MLCIGLLRSTCKAVVPFRYSTSIHRSRLLVTSSRRSSPKTQQTQAPIESSSEQPLLYGSLTVFTRILAGFGLVHVVSEYGLELTKCEGPSMMPTILPTGDEIILLERFTHRLYGLEGGDVASIRSLEAREKQYQFEQSTAKQTWYNAHLRVTKTESMSYWAKWVHVGQRLTTGICVGDVVVLHHPEREGTICKRVLGLPGDMVIRNHSKAWRSGPRQEESPVDDTHNHSSSSSSLLVVPDGHIWVEGDNSTNSSDSRHYGPVPASLVLGKVLLRIWPLRGQALILRGPRPQPPMGVPFTGSTILPAGYEGEAMQ